MPRPRLPLVALSLLVSVAVAGAKKPKPQPCPPGRFLVDPAGGPLLPAQSPSLDALGFDP